MVTEFEEANTGTLLFNEVWVNKTIAFPSIYVLLLNVSYVLYLPLLNLYLNYSLLFVTTALQAFAPMRSFNILLSSPSAFSSPPFFLFFCFCNYPSAFPKERVLSQFSKKKKNYFGEASSRPSMKPISRSNSRMICVRSVGANYLW